MSGLIAARDVLAARYEPLVLEAAPWVGGRILTEVIDGVPFELGTQWIGDTHHRMAALATELGVGIYPQFEEGEQARKLQAGTRGQGCVSVGRYFRIAGTPP